MTHMCVVLGRVLLNFKHISLNLTNAIYGVRKEAKTNQVMIDVLIGPRKQITKSQ